MGAAHPYSRWHVSASAAKAFRPSMATTSHSRRDDKNQNPLGLYNASQAMGHLKKKTISFYPHNSTHFGRKG